MLTELAPLLEPGDIVDRRRQLLLPRTPSGARRSWPRRNLKFFGMGVSGGEQGALWGPSLMPGGPREAYDILEPMLDGDRRQGRRRPLRDLHRPRRQPATTSR